MSESESTLPRRQLGRYLRELRLQAGLTLSEAAQRIERSISTLQRIETGQCDRIRLLDIRELCDLYGADEDETAGILGLAQQAPVKSWWLDPGSLIPDSFNVYMGLEADARRLTSYAPDVVPGILQTPAYAREMLRAALPDQSAEDIERRLRLKMKRHSRLTRKRQPIELDVVILESALHRTVGGPKVMSPQLRYIADASTLENVTVRVLPFNAGIPLGDPMNPFVVLSFGGENRGASPEPRLVYLETYTGEMYLEKPDDVRRYHEAQQALADAALDDSASRSLLRRTAKEFGS